MTTNQIEMIIQRVDELWHHIDKRLDVVERKQDITNGRVNDLEAERDRKAGYAQRVGEEDAGRSRGLDRAIPAVFGVLVFVAGVVLSHYWPV